MTKLAYTNLFRMSGGVLLVAALTLGAGCGGGKSHTDSLTGEEQASQKSSGQTATADASSGKTTEKNTPVTETADQKEKTRTSPFDRGALFTEFDDSAYTDSEEAWDESEMPEDPDAATAVDDDIWRQFDLAEEYHSLGVIANREGSWEEAQYYFEKTLSILADMDIETDSVFTPEAVKYTTILNNTIADYQVSLRSSGRLSEDVSSSVILDRFYALSDKLKGDTIVTKMEVGDGGKEPTYDLPIVMNDRVKSSIVYFQTVARGAFTRYLSRTTKYGPMMKKIIKEYKMPEDLVYLSLVESGYNPHAYSWARAMGLWQFIASTGRLYDLDRDWWMDERKDPIKSTHAAMQFLRDLYTQFGDWELAMAAYNGGPGRVSRTIKSQNTRDFWKMRLRKQTMDYVPLIMAATIICKNPEKYGFTDIVYEPELTWDEVLVNKPVELRTVADALGVSTEALVELNPELLRKTTPPGQTDYKLKVPKGYSEQFYASYEAMAASTAASMVRHRIKKGETLSSIAAKYGVSRYAIQETNKLKSKSLLIAGRELTIPVPSNYAASKNNATTKTREYTAKSSVYTVQRGDNLWAIANAFGTSIDQLRRENYMEASARIYVGQKLKIPADASKLEDKNTYAATPAPASKDNKPSEAKQKSTTASAPATHTVRSGETLSTIARKYGTTVSTLRKWNDMGSSNRIRAGQVLQVRGDATAEYVVHQIRRGENLSTIAKKYSTTVDKIISSNKIANPNELVTGQKLTIYLE